MTAEESTRFQVDRITSSAAPELRRHRTLPTARRRWAPRRRKRTSTSPLSDLVPVTQWPPPASSPTSPAAPSPAPPVSEFPFEVPTPRVGSECAAVLAAMAPTTLLTAPRRRPTSCHETGPQSPTAPDGTPCCPFRQANQTRDHGHLRRHRRSPCLGGHSQRRHFSAWTAPSSPRSRRGTSESAAGSRRPDKDPEPTPNNPNAAKHHLDKSVTPSLRRPSAAPRAGGPADHEPGQGLFPPAVESASWVRRLSSEALDDVRHGRERRGGPLHRGVGSRWSIGLLVETSRPLIRNATRSMTGSACPVAKAAGWSLSPGQVGFTFGTRR
jgi:hypothetical protein